MGWPVSLSAVIGAAPKDELRLVRYSGGTWTELTRVIDVGGPTEWIWARLAASIAAGGTDSSYYLYYSNSAASPAPSNPATVFEVYESMAGPTLGSAWTSQGSVAFTGAGEVSTGYGGSFRTVVPYGPGYAFDWVMRQPTYLSRYWGGFQRDGTFFDQSPWAIWIARDNTPEIWPEFTEDQSIVTAGSRLAVGAAAHRYGVDRLGDRFIFRYENVVQFSHMPGGTYTTLLNPRVTNESNTAVYFSNLRIRQTANPFPTVVMGPVEP
jgi:hypothetical protein